MEVARQLRNDQKLIDNFHSIATSLRYLTVHSDLQHNLPKSLIVASCNLKIGKSIGQGKT